ncbi:unnamed protein product [Clavelina lepadiformis]|uniref:Uncharacterized protein n=1 Tax=Clavelina lepadiformis TaxID=159417 RepID=A0ABP0F1G3_CLALP
MTDLREIERYVLQASSVTKAKINTTKKITASMDAKPKRLYEQKAKTPSPSHKRVDFCGVSEKLNGGRKSFQRKDTPWILKVGAKCNVEHTPSTLST